MPSQYANCYWRFPRYYFKFMWGCQGRKAVHYHTCKTLILVGIPCEPTQNPQKFCRMIVDEDCLGRKNHSIHGGTGCAASLISHALCPALSALPALRSLLLYPRSSFLLDPTRGCITGLFWLFICCASPKAGPELPLCITGLSTVPDTEKAAHKPWLN